MQKPELSDRSDQQQHAIFTSSPFTKTQNTPLWKTCPQTIPYSKKWPFKTCHPLTAWFPAPEGKEVKKKKKIDKQIQNLTKETRMQCLNQILCAGQQVFLETNNLSWERAENGRNGKGGFSHTRQVSSRNGVVFMNQDHNTSRLLFKP